MSRLTWITVKELEREIKKHKRQMSLETQHENFIAVVRKRERLAASEVKMSGSEKESEQEYNQQILFVRPYDIASVKQEIESFTV